MWKDAKHRRTKHGDACFSCTFDEEAKQGHIESRKKYADAEDEALVSLFQQGDASAFDAINERYRSYILRSSLSYVKDKEAAKDLTQEILIKLFLQLPHFRREAKLKTWIYAIVHHTCIDHLRQNKKRSHEVISEKLSDKLHELLDDLDERPKDIDMEVLRQLLEQMTPEGRLILLMKYVEKQSIKDIQNTLNLSESAIKMRLKRARNVLRVLYAKNK